MHRFGNSSRIAGGAGRSFGFWLSIVILLRCSFSSSITDLSKLSFSDDLIEEGFDTSRRTQLSPCAEELYDYFLFVDLFGSTDQVTQGELTILEQDFQDTYNNLTSTTCGNDDLRNIDSVTIETDEIIPGHTETSRRFLNSRRKKTKRFRIRVRGRARGSGRRKALFNDGLRRHLLPDEQEQHSVRKKTDTNTRAVRDDTMVQRRGGEKKEGKGNGRNRNLQRNRRRRRRNGRRRRRGNGNGRQRGWGIQLSWGNPPPSPPPPPASSGTTPEPPPDPASCDCPEPPLSEFLASFNALIDLRQENGLLPNIDSAQLIEELEEFQCPASITEFQDDTYVTVLADPDAITPAEYDALFDAFMEKYNRLNALSSSLCDPLFHVIDSVELSIVPDALPDEVPDTRRRLRKKKKRTRFRFRSKGRCRGCGSRSALLNDGLRRRRELHSRFKKRRLQAATCYCPASVDQRKPTEGEFTIAYREEFELLKLDGNLTNVFELISVRNTPEPPFADPHIEVLSPGESFTVTENVSSPATCGAGEFGAVDVCIMPDLTGSFVTDIDAIAAAGAAIFQDISAMSASAYFAVAGFADYTAPFAYQLFQTMSSLEDDWTDALDNLVGATVDGGDWQEAQYDAIVGAARGINSEPDCGWSDDRTVVRILVTSTDSGFHVPADNPALYQNDAASTLQALEDESIRLVGLKAAGALGELDALAAGTDGTIKTFRGSSGVDVVPSLVKGINDLPCSILPVVVGCEDLIVTFDPPRAVVSTGGSALFTETFQVPSTRVPPYEYNCEIQYSANGIIVDDHPVTITVPLP